MSLIGKNIGNYRIVSKLGEGGMGTVYLGEHPLIGKKVAVKVLLSELAANEDIVSRFFNEAKAVNDIGHQNIVDVVDFGKMTGDHGQDVVYFIMEYLDGESLSARLQRTGITFPETLHIMQQCCSALSASHAKGIVHRDLKPENIYLCPRGGNPNFIKILDFGIAKLTGHGSTSSKTRTGLVIGTPAYMSPEQCEGKGVIDHRSDIYSLGIVMYELITGRVPFAGEGFGEMLVSHITRPAPKPSEFNPHVTPEIEALVLHALEKDRNRRFQTMDEFLAAVREPQRHLAQYRNGTDPWSVPTQTSKPRPGGSTMYLDDDARAPGPITRSQPREPSPTTLSGAAAELTGGGRPRRRRGRSLAAGLTVTVLLAVAGAGVVVWRGQKSEQKIPVAIPTPPPVSDDVTVTITSDPKGARVFRAGEVLVGVTPVDLKVKRGDPGFDVQLRLDGYSPRTSEVPTAQNTTLSVSLAKEEPAEVPPPVVEPPPVAEKRVVKQAVKKPRRREKTEQKPAYRDPEIELLKPAFLK